MRSLVVCYALALIPWFAAQSKGAPIPATFTLDPAQSSLNLKLVVTSGPLTVSDNDQTSMSGVIEATVDLGTGPNLPATGGIRFVGGRADAAGPLELSLFVFLLLDLDVNVNGLSTTFQTRVPVGSLTAMGPAGIYQFDAAQHQLVQDRGTLVANGTALGSPINQTMDFAQTPLVGTPDAGTLGSLILAEVGSNLWVKSYSAVLTFPIDFTEPLPIEGFGGTATAVVTGTLIGTGIVLQANGLSGDYNRDGTVDTADYTVWRDSVGDIVSPGTSADANFNGFVENSEYFPWRDHFGESTIAGAGSTYFANSVPEPSAAYLLPMLLISLGYATIDRYSQVRSGTH